MPTNNNVDKNVSMDGGNKTEILEMHKSKSVLNIRSTAIDEISINNIQQAHRFMSLKNGLLAPVKKQKKQLKNENKKGPSLNLKNSRNKKLDSRPLSSLSRDNSESVLRELGDKSRNSAGKEPSLLSSMKSLKSHAKALKQRATENTNPPSRFKEAGEARELFKVGARKVFIVMSWMAVLSGKDDKIEGQLKTFLDIAQEIDDNSSEQSRRIKELTGVAFNVKDFRAKRDVHLPKDVIAILTLRSEHRTPEMIQKVLPSLQVIDAFADYPIHLQQKLAKVAWFQHVDAKKVILRQGHYAENFYFVIVGAAIAKQLVKDEHTGKASVITVARMKKGQSFGEQDIISNTERTCTVESLTHLETLVVGREDFLNIFINVIEGQEPEHITFCRQLPFLNGFPVETFIDDQNACMINYFRRGCVIVTDNKSSEWIYIVQSGSCAIFKKLRQVKPRKMLNKRPCSANTLQRLMNNNNNRSDHALTRTRSAPDDLRQSNPSFVKLRLEDVTNRGALDDQQNWSDIDSVGASNTPGPYKNDTYDNRSISTPLPSEPNQTPPRDIPPTTPEPEDQERFPVDCNRGRTGGAIDHNAMTSQATSRSSTAMDHHHNDRQGSGKHVTIMIASDPHSGATSRLTNRPHTQNPCFVQLKLLPRGEVFGLEEVIFENDPENAIRPPTTSVTLVSNGAEVIMLSKQHFLRHATEATRAFIKEHVRLFPAEESLQDKLQNTVNWSLFRQKTLHSVITRRTHTYHAVENQTLSQPQSRPQVHCL